MHPVASVTKQYNLVLEREISRHASQGAGLAASSDVVFIYLLVYLFMNLAYTL